MTKRDEACSTHRQFYNSWRPIRSSSSSLAAWPCASTGAGQSPDDLDICYRRTPGNIQAVAAAFAPLHPYLRGAPAGLPFRFDARTIQSGLNFTLATDHGDLSTY